MPTLIPILFAALCLLSWIDDASADPPTLSIDLATAGTETGEIMRIYGATGDGRSGVPVSGGYDCDGDGHVDMGFSGIKSSPLGRFRAGDVTLVFGESVIGGSIDTAGFATNVLKIAGDQPYESAGAEIWMDDVTGDGLGDLMICRQNHTPVPGREGAGGLSILVGGPWLRDAAGDLQFLDLRNLPTNIVHCLFVGEAAYDRLGIWVRAGDVDGDGINDVVVAADEVDAPGEKNRGAVYVIRGGTHLAATQTNDLSQFDTFSLTGNVARIEPPVASGNYHLGATLQTGDLDSNGKHEVLMGATLNRAGAALRLPGAPSGTGQASGGAPRGKMFIAWDDHFPPGAWPAGYTIDLGTSTNGVTAIQGDSFNRSFGEELLGGEDYDGDGNPDLFVGDLVANGINGVNSGVGHVFYNARTLRDQTLNLDTSPTGLSFSVVEGPRAGSIGADTATQGDYNGDGYGDLVFGSPCNAPFERDEAGSIHVLYGQAGGWPAVIDLAEGMLPPTNDIAIVFVAGANGGDGSGDVGDTLCYSAAAGDIDGDGIMDMLINEMRGNGVASNAVDVGNLVVVSGRGLLPTALQFRQWQRQPGGDIATSFYTETGVLYRVDSSPILEPPNWSPVSAVVTGTGARVDFLAPGPSGMTSEFYRIIQDP